MTARKSPEPVWRSIEERSAAGKACRDQLKRVDQAAYKAPGKRKDLAERLLSAVKGRQEELLPIRWGRMSQSPFRFYRGTAALMASDIGAAPVAGLETGLCGDAHLLNLGAYADPEGRLVFDLNDFDEACRGPFEWDLKRLATSLVLAGRESSHKEVECAAAVQAMAASWRENMLRYAEMPARSVAKVLVRAGDGRKPLAPVFAAAALDTPASLIKKSTESDGKGFFRFGSKAPLTRRLDEKELALALAALPEYFASLPPARQQLMERYAPMDGAQRVMGCGSVGVLNWIILFRGVSESDALFLEFKAANPSCWRPSEAGHRGQAIVGAAQQLQTWADPFLGWTTLKGQACLVRQWSDHKAAIDPAMLTGPGLQSYAALCGMVLAKAQARTGDPAMLAGYAGGSDKLDKALATFAKACADQATLDWETFKTEIAERRFPVLLA
ncbi:MAG TPA: DUF2252 domain-containing protein [Holophagaceae bacterium]|nr:DUF2252 domain-containing protein [Holophagaceae bacterium]